MTDRQRLPNRRVSAIETIEFDGIKYDVGFGVVGSEAGQLIKEVFITADAKHKHGSMISVLCQDSAVLISLLLQHGVSPHHIKHSLLRTGGSPTQPAHDPASIISCVVDHIEEFNREVEVSE